jgi:hypothetical protein
MKKSFHTVIIYACFKYHKYYSLKFNTVFIAAILFKVKTQLRCRLLMFTQTRNPLMALTIALKLTLCSRSTFFLSIEFKIVVII